MAHTPEGRDPMEWVQRGVFAMGAALVGIIMLAASTFISTTVSAIGQIQAGEAQLTARVAALEVAEKQDQATITATQADLTSARTNAQTQLTNLQQEVDAINRQIAIQQQQQSKTP
ncbi:MAG: hypothetical protein J2P17_14595 [Mycobacterium sp.]|nr:hypothetical protein [Mycobacterium sp.]